MDGTSVRGQGGPQLGQRESSDVQWILPILILGLRYRRWLIAVPLVLAVVSFLVSAVRPRFVAESRFKPQVGEMSASGVAGVAAQFGLNLASVSGTESLDFYLQLSKSRDLLRELALTHFEFATNPGGDDSLSGSLVELYDIGEEEDSREHLIEAVERLDESVVVRADRGAGLITVRAHARWLELAEAVNTRLLELVNDFNLEKRQTQAAAERIFVEGRLEDARADLEAAESDLEEFNLRNRIVDSPRLELERGRLQRRVDLRQQVYVTLAQAYEESRIEEVRNTPVITIIDHPVGAGVLANRPVLNAVLAAIVGFALTALVVVGREFLTREGAARPHEMLQLKGQLREIAAGLRIRFGSKTDPS